MKKNVLFSIALSTLSVVHATEKETAQTNLESGPVRLVCVTPDAEVTSAYIALTSIMPNGDIESVKHTRVLNGHIRSSHWSALEHGYMTLRIDTSRAISLQLIRHRSFTFQQFSQKYANTISTIGTELPLPDLRKRKGTLTTEQQEDFKEKIQILFKNSLDLYKELIAAQVKTECARFILPEITPTIVHMTGNIRSWIHFIERCSGRDSQPEMHVIVAGCKEIFQQVFPNISQYLKKSRPKLGW